MAQTVQVIDGEGAFNNDGLVQFVNNSGVAASQANYQVIAIMGPQSSGKSTLMNHLFGTSFQEMDAMSGRQQTTKGVWMAKSPKIDEISTMVLDLEGTDGRERGEDDTNFERQSALFALAVADVLLINIWCHDIGREQGSGKPLMKTIFQVNLKLFAPEPNRRKTVLLFVIRDKSKTPQARLEQILGEDVHKMWDSISKPPQYVDSRIDDFFEIQYAALPHYEEKYDDFMADSVVLRRRFTPEDERSLVRVYDKLPADALPLSLQNIWSVIRSQKDLNLPAHKIMVANIRCNEIKDDQLRNFLADQAWQTLEQEASQSLVPGFGERAYSLMDSCIRGYDQEAMYFDHKVRGDNRELLLDKLYAILSKPLQNQLQFLVAAIVSQFDKDFRLALSEGEVGFSQAAAVAKQAAAESFDAGARELMIRQTPLSGDTARGLLLQQIDDAVDKLKHLRVKDALHTVDKDMTQRITVPMIELLQTFPPGLWPRLHAVRDRAVSNAAKSLFDELKGVELTQQEGQALQDKLESNSSRKMQAHLQEAALTRVSRMKDRFQDVFALDESKTPRTWKAKDNIPKLARDARLAAANVLAQLAVERPADYSTPDVVEQAILRMARQDVDDKASSSSSSRDDGEGEQEEEFDLSSATSWPGVAAADVLIQPHEARMAWREFMSASSLLMQQAQMTQQANLMANKRSPPVWALAAIMFLGWNEFMAVLFNPIYLIVIAIASLLGWQLYGELDVDGEMQMGAVPGLVSIGAKLWPTLVSVCQRTFAAMLAFAQEGGQAVMQQAHHQQDDGDEDSDGTMQHRQQQSPYRNNQFNQSPGGGPMRRKQATEAAGVQMTSMDSPMRAHRYTEAHKDK
eukprot:jgi/Chrzof1/11851/Cz06g12110.t1